MLTWPGTGFWVTPDGTAASAGTKAIEVKPSDSFIESSRLPPVGAVHLLRLCELAREVSTPQKTILKCDKEKHQKRDIEPRQIDLRILERRGQRHEYQWRHQKRFHETSPIEFRFLWL